MTTHALCWNAPPASIKKCARMYFSLLRDNRKLAMKHDKAGLLRAALRLVSESKRPPFAFDANPCLWCGSACIRYSGNSSNAPKIPCQRPELPDSTWDKRKPKGKDDRQSACMASVVAASVVGGLAWALFWAWRCLRHSQMLGQIAVNTAAMKGNNIARTLMLCL